MGSKWVKVGRRYWEKKKEKLVVVTCLAKGVGGDGFGGSTREDWV